MWRTRWLWAKVYAHRFFLSIDKVENCLGGKNSKLHCTLLLYRVKNPSKLKRETQLITLVLKPRLSSYSAPQTAQWMGVYTGFFFFSHFVFSKDIYFIYIFHSFSYDCVRGDTSWVPQQSPNTLSVVACLAWLGLLTCLLLLVLRFCRCLNEWNRRHWLRGPCTYIRTYCAL